MTCQKTPSAACRCINSSINSSSNSSRHQNTCNLLSWLQSANAARTCQKPLSAACPCINSSSSSGYQHMALGHRLSSVQNTCWHRLQNRSAGAGYRTVLLAQASLLMKAATSPSTLLHAQVKLLPARTLQPLTPTSRSALPCHEHLQQAGGRPASAAQGPHTWHQQQCSHSPPLPTTAGTGLTTSVGSSSGKHVHRHYHQCILPAKPSTPPNMCIQLAKSETAQPLTPI